MLRFFLAVCGGLFCWGAALAAGLPGALDLRAEAALARRGGYPLVILFSREDCRYCEAVRRDHLLPTMAAKTYGGALVVRQVDQDSERPLIDFAGRQTTHAAFAKAEKVKLVPVVAFYGEAGQRLAEPIVGLRLPDFYNVYLEDALQKGRRQGSGLP